MLSGDVLHLTCIVLISLQSSSVCDDRGQTLKRTFVTIVVANEENVYVCGDRCKRRKRTFVSIVGNEQKVRFEQS